MRPLLAQLAALVLLAIAAGAGDDPEAPADPNRAIRPSSPPIVMAYLREPTLTVVGADSPAFALYDDGTVIFRSIKGADKDRSGASRSGFRAVKLTPQELAALRNTLALDDIKRPQAKPAEKDVPVELVLKDADGFFAARVSQIDSRRAVAGVSTMLSYDHPNAVPWLPDEVEVLLWPVDDAGEDTITWPADWAMLKHAAKWTLPVHADHEKPPEPSSGFSIKLEMSQVAKLRSILRKSAHKQPILIDGKPHLASYRLPFPGERGLGSVE